jgi:CheY-like chemotaxis protein
MRFGMNHNLDIKPRRRAKRVDGIQVNLVTNHRASGALKSIKVVAVDDDADSRELLKTILERSSAEAIVVSSGQEALATINSFRPDVLVCDLAMPEMGGYELLNNVRRLEPELGQVPAIAFTAAAHNEDRARARRAGFQAHLAKPVEPDELIATILELLRN